MDGCAPSLQDWVWRFAALLSSSPVSARLLPLSRNLSFVHVCDWMGRGGEVIVVDRRGVVVNRGRGCMTEKRAYLFFLPSRNC